MCRNLVLYVLTVVIFGSLVRFVLNQGTKLENEQNISTAVAELHPKTSSGADLGEVVEKILEVKLAPG
jgi:hypothetical protein